MKTASPFFLLSVVALVLWIEPSGRVLLTAQELGKVMEIEGFILFFCFMYSGFLGGTREQRSAIPMLLVTGFGIGGTVAAQFGGAKLVVIYVLSLLLHMIDAFWLQRHERRTEAGTNGLALLAFIGCGFVAWYLVPPGSKAYPPVFEDGWFFRIGGQQVMAWACAYFAVAGYLQTKKHRIFAHLREEVEEEERQTPR